jgi:hypothetical protein
MSTRWRSLSERTRRELDALQCGRTEGVKLVPMPSMGREPQDRRFSVILSADLGDVGARTSRARRARREHTIWVELELFLQPDFPNTPPYLHCHSKDIEHWSMDRSGRIDIGRLIEWSPRIELTSLLSHVRQNLISEMALSPEKARRPARSASPRGGVVTPVLAGAMSGEWRALGYSDGTDTKRKGLQEELEEFTLDVRPDGYVSGYPTYELDNPADVFNLSGTVKNDSRGQLRLQMQQIYSTTNNVTKWSAKVGSDGTTLHGGEWSGSCAGTFKAERVTTPSPAPAPRSARPVYRAPQPEPQQREQIQLQRNLLVGRRAEVERRRAEEEERRHQEKMRTETLAKFMKERFTDEVTARQILTAEGWDLQRAMVAYMPPVPQSPLSGRTLVTSNFMAAYDSAEVPEGPMELGDILGELIRAYCAQEDIPWKGEGQPFFRKMQKEAMANAQELAAQIPEAAQRLWTSALTLRGREFCYILNKAVRGDLEELSEPTAQMTRAINQLCVTVGSGRQAAVHPPDNVCFRGGGFDDKYRMFFCQGRQFRQPAYLASSFSRAVAAAFLERSSMASKVLWLVRIHPELKCAHVNLVKRTNVPGEEEYLFAPYSAFTVISATWNAGTSADPHVIELQAAADNKLEPEDLPLAPWS